MVVVVLVEALLLLRCLRLVVVVLVVLVALVVIVIILLVDALVVLRRLRVVGTPLLTDTTLMSHSGPVGAARRLCGYCRAGTDDQQGGHECNCESLQVRILRDRLRSNIGVLPVRRTGAAGYSDCDGGSAGPSHHRYRARPPVSLEFS